MMYSTYFKQTVKSVYDTAVRSNAEICQTKINFDQLLLLYSLLCVWVYSIFIPFYLYLFLCLFVYLFIYLFIYLFVYLFIYLLVYLFVYLFVCLFIYLFTYLHIYLIIFVKQKINRKNPTPKL